MLISVVLDPEALKEEYFESQSGYEQNIRKIFEALRYNGVLLVDSQSYILSEIRQYIEALPTKHSQHLMIFLEELGKGKRRRIITTNYENQSLRDKGALLSYIRGLAIDCCADAVCLAPDKIGNAKDFLPSQEVISANDYLDSKIEEERENYLCNLPPLSYLKDKEACRILGRALRFTKWIRFYDKQIGKGNNLQAFFAGIKKIIEIWQSYAYFSLDSGVTIEIITSCTYFMTEGTSNDVKKKASENHDCIVRVEEQLISRLRERFPSFNFDLRVKSMPNKEWHHRYLEGQFFVLGVDTGFDLLNRDGSFRSATVNLRNGDLDHLQEIRGSQDIDYGCFISDEVEAV